MSQFKVGRIIKYNTSIIFFIILTLFSCSLNNENKMLVGVELYSVKKSCYDSNRLIIFMKENPNWKPIYISYKEQESFIVWGIIKKSLLKKTNPNNNYIIINTNNSVFMFNPIYDFYASYD